VAAISPDAQPSGATGPVEVAVDDNKVSAGRARKWEASPVITDASLDLSLGGGRVTAMREERHHVIDRPGVSRTDHDLVAFQRPLEDVPCPDVGRLPNLPRDDRPVPLRYF